MAQRKFLTEMTGLPPADPAIALSDETAARHVPSSYVPRVARNTLVQSFAGIFSRVVGLLFIILIARRLGDESLGAYRLAITYIGYFSVIATFGLGPFLVREMSANLNGAYRVFAGVNILRVTLAILCGVTILGTLPLLKYNSQVNLLIVVYSIIVLTGVLIDTNTNVFFAYQRMDLGLYILIAGSIFYLGLGWLALGLGGVLGVAIAGVVTTVFQCILGFYLINRYLFRIRVEFDWKHQLSIIATGVPFFVGGIASFYNDKVDVFLLSQLSTFQVIGWYSAAYLILDVSKIVPVALATAIYPVLAAKYRLGQKELDRTIRAGVRAMLLITCLIPAIIVPTTGEIIKIMFGPKFSQSVIPLQLVIGSVIFYGLNYIVGSAIFAANGQRPLMVVNFLILAVNLGMNFWLIPLYAHIGASLATIGSYSAGTLMHLALARRLGISSGLPLVLLRPGLAALVAGIAAFLLLQVSWLVSVSGGTVAYIVVLWILREIGPDDFKLVRRLLSTGSGS